MKKESKRMGRSVFLRFLSSYLLILCIPVVLFSFIMARTTSLLEDKVLQVNQLHLEQARNAIDSQLKNMYDSILAVNYNSSIYFLLESPGGRTPPVSLVTKSAEDLSAFTNEDSKLYVYARNYDALLTSEGSYTYLPQIYGSVLNYGDMDFNAFHTEILQGKHDNQYYPAVEGRVENKQGRWILYAQSIPMTKAYTRGTVLYFLNERALLDSMQRADDGGWACVVTPEGEVIAGTEGTPSDAGTLLGQGAPIERSWGGDTYLVSTLQSGNSNWTYVAATPKAAVNQEVRGVWLLVLLLLLVYMVIGGGVSCLFASHNLKPVLGIFAMMRKEDHSGGQGGNVYRLLQNYVGNLVEENHRLAESLDGQSEALRDLVAGRLLHGAFGSEEEVTDFAEKRPDMLNHSVYLAAVVNFCPNTTHIDKAVLDRMMLGRVSIKDVSGELLGGEAVFCDLDVNKLGFIFWGDTDAAALSSLAQETLGTLCRRLSQDYQMPLFIGISTCCETAMKLNYAYLQADEAMRVAEAERRPILMYAELPDEGDCPYITDSMCEGLRQSVAEGNLKQSRSILKILDVENFERRALSENSRQSLLLELQKIVGALLHDAPEDVAREARALLEQQEEEPESERQHNQFYRCTRALLHLCGQNQETASGKGKKIHEEIMRFINENRHDNNLCLSMVATQFKLSEPYISHLLKKRLDINFSTYLEEKRIKDAVAFLRTTAYSVEEVATLVGYNNPHTFRRAFNKVTGVNPSHYRNSAKGE